jgi:flagella basal body P-ring formation protein FlgA
VIPALALGVLLEVTAVARMPAGTVIDQSLLEGPAAEVSAMVGRQVTRSVFAGQALNLTDTKPADQVARNALVRIIAVKGPMRIETRGRALGAGAVGDDILVVNLDSRRTITARIVGPNEVEVSP